MLEVPKTPLDVHCGFCLSPVGKPCVRLSRTSQNARMTNFHPARQNSFDAIRKTAELANFVKKYGISGQELKKALE